MLLHLLRKSGEVDHVEFTRKAWSDAPGDPSVARYWGHAEGDCSDPVEEVRVRWKLVSQVVESRWPPESELTPEFLAELRTMSLDDARYFLRARAKPTPPTQLGPRTDKRGQYSLF